jgi:hypothetical protein
MSSITDLPSSELEIHIAKNVKKIYNYQGAPKRLTEFEKLIDKLRKQLFQI